MILLLYAGLAMILAGIGLGVYWVTGRKPPRVDIRYRVRIRALCDDFGHPTGWWYWDVIRTADDVMVTYGTEPNWDRAVDESLAARIMAESGWLPGLRDTRPNPESV